MRSLILLAEDLQPWAQVRKQTSPNSSHQLLLQEPTINLVHSTLAPSLKVNTRLEMVGWFPEWMLFHPPTDTIYKALSVM